MDALMAIYNHPNFGAYIEGLCQIVTACTAITMLTPTKSDDKVFNIILKGLNLLSGNFCINNNDDDVRKIKAKAPKMRAKSISTMSAMERRNAKIAQQKLLKLQRK